MVGETLRIEDLREAVRRAESGAIDADLGAGVIKQRIARVGQGKSGGYRAVPFFRRGDRAFFLYGFAKSDQDNIGRSELAGFKAAAKHVLRLLDAQLEELLLRGDFRELEYR